MILHSRRILFHLSQNLLHDRVLQNTQYLRVPLCPFQDFRLRCPGIGLVERGSRACKLGFDFAGVGTRVGRVCVGGGGSDAGIDGFLVFAHCEVGSRFTDVGFHEIGV